MKKILLFAVAFAIVSVGISQVSQYSPKAWYNTVIEKKAEKVAEQEATNYTKPVNPTVTNLRAADIVIGETWYDLQTNSSMANRIYAFEDGTIGVTWTRGFEHTAYPDRGTGYNYYDGTDWGPYPEERVEATRTGWPNLAPYGVNGEIICSHTGGDDGLMFSWRENKGEGDWNYFNLPGPDAQKDLLWPRIITSGENNEIVHVIACAGNAATYEELTMALLYSRTSDGGQTWDYENVILDGMGSDYTSGWGGDDYAWAQPVGNTIAFVAFGGIKDGIVMKSTDNGDSWERITFYESPQPFFDGNGGDLPQCGGGDGYNAIVIDDEEMIHVAFGRQIHLDDTPGDDAWSYYPYSDGLVYWNETMAALDTAQIQADILPADWTTMNLYQNGQLAAWTQENGEDTIVGVAYYGASLTSMPQLVATRDINGKKIIQLFYGALSVGFSNPGTETNYRHIWGRFTEGDGMWSEFTDYTGDILHMFNESVYPSVAQTMPDDTYHIMYQTDMVPGNSLQPTPPTHDPALNNIVYLPVSPLQVNTNELAEQSFEVAQNTPNPAFNSTSILVTSDVKGVVNFTVNNILGQVVYSNVVEKTNNSHIINLDVSNYDSGVYFYTIEMGNKSVTKKMIVR